MIKKYICENLYVVTIHCKMQVKMIKIITKINEVFIHILNMS